LTPAFARFIPSSFSIIALSWEAAMEEQNHQARPADQDASAATRPEETLYVGGIPVLDLADQGEAATPVPLAQPEAPAARAGVEPAPDAPAGQPATRPDGRPELRQHVRDYVPPRQRGPLVKFVLARMPAEVRKAFDPRKHEAFFVADPPLPMSDLTNRRVDVMLALHGSLRDSIERWEDRMFQAFGLATAAILAVLAVYLEHPAELNGRRLLIATLVATFGFLASVYFWRAADAHSDNGAMLVKVEAALGLCEVGMYLDGTPFVGWTGVWVPDRRGPVLFTALVVVTFFAALVILVFPVSAS
jgi:hypothetical protein